MALRQEEFTSLCDDVDLDRDRALVERCQAGDSAAFGNLYARYYERLLRFCLRRLNDRHEAEDAAQEAFARAWKALPKFAGERRFYPWLTVIAGNICTDMLRRRSRSTPTDDMELSAHQPVGSSAADTSEELVLAAVDGELVNRALDRLSVRHRHVLAMREGSGWTYQQIADHEGVEIGTIETLLWRARQALRREFNVLSESKGVLAGFLAGAGALVRRSMFRIAHKGAVAQQSSGGTGGLRTALTGVAVTGAAVAAALVAPHVLATSHPTAQSALPAQAASVLSASSLSTTPHASTPAAPGAGDGGGPGAGGSTSNSATGGGKTSNVSSGGSGAGAGGGLLGVGSGGGPTLPGAGNVVPQVVGAVGGTVGGVTKTLTNTVSGLENTVSGLANTVSGLANTVKKAVPTTTPTLPPVVTKLIGGL